MIFTSRRAHGRAAIATVAATATALAGSVAVVDTAAAQPNPPATTDALLYENPFSGVTIDIPVVGVLVPVPSDSDGARELNFYRLRDIENFGESGDAVVDGAEPVISVGVVDSLVTAFGAVVNYAVQQAAGEAAADQVYVPVVDSDDQGDATISFYAANDLDEGNQPIGGAEPIATFTIPAGQDGESVELETNDDGSVTFRIVGADGESVGDSVTISNGEDGRGVESFEVDDDGNVTVFYTDGASEELGNFRGEDGTTYVPVLSEDTVDGRTGTWVRFYDEDQLGEDDLPVEGVEPVAETFVADGVDGTDGADGTNGNSVAVNQNDDGSVTVQVVNADGILVGEPVIIPAPVDGEDGAPGQDGAPGDDGEDGTTYVPVLSEDTVEGRTGTWVRFYDQDQLDENGVPVEGVDPVAETFVADGVDGTDGADGTNGNSVTVEENEDGSVTVQVVNADANPVGEPVIIPAPVDGEDGAPGQDGTPGAPGDDGEDGTDGRGIASITTDEDGNFLITYTDGETETVEVEQTDEPTGSSSADVDLSSELSSNGANPLLLIIPAVLAAVAALNIPTIQAALNSFAAAWF